MKNEYYGIPSTPTEDFLAHYGVKGMKWGVRKSIADNNGRRLDRHYRRAYKKLKKLEWKADPKEQIKYAKIHDKVAKVGFGVGLSGLGVSAGGYAANKLLKKKRDSALNALYHPGWGYDAFKEVDARNSGNMELYNRMVNERLAKTAKYENAKNNLNKYGKYATQVENISRQIGSVGLGVGLGAKAISANAKWRATKGNAKMKQKRDAWKKEMRKAFKNTKYQNLPKYETNRRTKKA